MTAMYDPWGVGEALQMSMRMYTHSKRATGRSTLLFEALKNGDSVVVCTRQHGDQIAQECKKRDIDVTILSQEPNRGIGHALSEISRRYNMRGNLYFDHTWFEALHLYQIQDTMSLMGSFMDDMEQRRAELMKPSRTPIMLHMDEPREFR